MNLKTIDNQNHQLSLEAANAWLKLKAAAEAAGNTVSISTAYRSPEYQKKLYSNYIQMIAAWERSGRIGSKPTPVAVPGKSKHETGMAVDVHVAQYPKLLDWLRKHASEFHFYETVKVENWHWEYCPDR